MSNSLSVKITGKWEESRGVKRSWVKKHNKGEANHKGYERKTEEISGRRIQ